MKKIIVCVLSLFVCAGLFAQTPRVAVADFDIDPGISRQEADVVYELFTAQLASTKKVTVADRVNLDKILAEMKFQTSDWSNKDKTASMGKVINATALIRGRLMKMGNWIYWTATMLDLNTARVMYAAYVRISDLGKAWDALPGFCDQLVGDIGKQELNPEFLTNVAVATFDVQGGITTQESAVITELFIAALVRTKRANVIDRTNFDKIIEEMKFQSSDWSDKNKTAAIGKVLNAQSVVRGQLMKLGSAIYWVTTVLDVNTAEILSSSRQQLNNLEEIWVRQNNNKQNEYLLSNTSNEIAARLPLPPPPNLFVGRWKSSRKVEGGYTLNCILNIKADGTITVEDYDILPVISNWGSNIFDGYHPISSYYDAPKRNGRGTGKYSNLQRINRNEIRIDYTLSLNGIPSVTKGDFPGVNGTAHFGAYGNYFTLDMTDPSKFRNRTGGYNISTLQACHITNQFRGKFESSNYSEQWNNSSVYYDDFTKMP